MLTSKTENYGISFLDSESVIDGLPGYKDYVDQLAESSTPADFTADYLKAAGISAISIRDINQDYSSENGATQSSKVVEIILSKSESDTTISVDVDDTTDNYSAKKLAMHRDWFKILELEKYGLTEEQGLKIFKQINKQSRILPSSGAHPEQYSPTLELASTAYLSTKLRDKDFIAQLNQNISSDEFGVWVQDSIISPVTTGPTSIFPHGALINVEKVKNDTPKKYFQINPGMENYLITPKNSSELNDMKLFFNTSDQKSCMGLLMDSMKDHLFKANLIQNMLLPADNPAEYVLASFGETRFQLIKIVEILKAMEASHKRLPDRIILFSEGRKAKPIENFFTTGDHRVIHIDNSSSQHSELEVLRNPRIQSILYQYGKEDTDITTLLEQ